MKKTTCVLKWEQTTINRMLVTFPDGVNFASQKFHSDMSYLIRTRKIDPYLKIDLPVISQLSCSLPNSNHDSDLILFDFGKYIQEELTQPIIKLSP